jgi:hypothetical protein
MNQKFDVKNYRIVENKQLLKEELGLIAAGLIALVSLLVGGGIGYAISFSRLYGGEKGKQAAEKVSSLKKNVDSAIDNSSNELLKEPSKKAGAKDEFKKIIGDYEESIGRASEIEDDGQRTDSSKDAANILEQQVNEFVKKYGLEVDVNAVLADIKNFSDEVMTKAQADIDFKNMLTRSLASSQSYRGLLLKTLELYNKNSASRRKSLVRFQKIYPIIARTRNLKKYYDDINAVLVDVRYNNINSLKAALANLEYTKKFAKISSVDEIVRYASSIASIDTVVENRNNIKTNEIDKLLTGAETPEDRKDTVDNFTTEEKKVVEDIHNLLLEANRDEKINNKIDNLNLFNSTISKLDSAFNTVNAWDAIKTKLGALMMAGHPVEELANLLVMYNNLKQTILYKNNEALKKILFNIDITDKNEVVNELKKFNTVGISTATPFKDNDIADKFILSLQALSKFLEELNKFNTGNLDDITSSVTESLNATLQDGTLVCEGCLVEYMNNHKNLITEAKYQGRSVPLGKPMRGDVKKFKVFVKDPSTGNIKKVNFGDPNMKIKKNIPARRKSFRARHKCATAKDRTSARYWSCRMWEHKQLDESINNRMKELAGLIED